MCSAKGSCSGPRRHRGSTRGRSGTSSGALDVRMRGSMGPIHTFYVASQWVQLIIPPNKTLLFFWWNASFHLHIHIFMYVYKPWGLANTLMALKHYDFVLKERFPCAHLLSRRTRKLLEVLKAELFPKGKWNLLRNSRSVDLRNEAYDFILKALCFHISQSSPPSSVAGRLISRVQTINEPA